jgi:16S rRNA (cytosine1402-N4)-methyltransferase
MLNLPNEGEIIVCSEFVHETVLRQETVESLIPSNALLASLSQSPLVWVDCTLGGAGHTTAYLECLRTKGFEGRIKIVGIDRDPHALSVARERLQALTQGFSNIEIALIAAPFSEGVAQLPNASVHALCADFGVSSPQIDLPERGFSLRHDGPLDMRMNPSQGRTARDIVENATEIELTRIFQTYGEEPRARKLAQAIITDRQKGKLPPNSTLAFAQYCERILAYRGSRTPPATRIFQALRIAVNDELGEIERLLAHVPRIITAFGKASFISFHSLEDRLVKTTLRTWERAGIVDDQAPIFPHMTPPTWGKETPRGGVVAAPEELLRNTRSHSARLRTFCFNEQIRSQ